VVKALLAAGASISQKGLFSDALDAAVSAGNQTIANLLLQSGYQSSHFLDEDEVLFMAAAHSMDPPPSHVDLLSALDLTHYSERSPDARTVNAIEGQDLSFEDAYKSIHEGVEVKNVTKFARLERRGHFRSHTLLVATETGQKSVVRSMLDYRSAIGLSLLDIGIILKIGSAAGRLGIVNHVLSLPELPRKHIPRALELASWYGHVAIIKRLLECEEAYGPPPNSNYVPFLPNEEKQRNRVFSDKKKSRWSDYFPLSYQVVETSETAENSDIVRILLLGCRANAPATVELALELATESGLQNLFATALAVTIGSDSEKALEVLLRHYPTIDAIMLEKACAHAEEDESFRVLYVLLQHDSDHSYQMKNYWKVYTGAVTIKHRDLISYLDTHVQCWQDDSVFLRRFVEAAQRGYVSAMKAWEIRLFQFTDHELLMSQALDQACANGHATVASYLIERGVDVNTFVEEPIQSPSLVDCHSMSRPSDGVTKNEVWPRTALQACIQATPQYNRIYGIWDGEINKFKDNKREFLSIQQTVIELLLRKNANVNVVDRHGRSALHFAALLCPVETVHMMLSNGAAIDVSDKDHKTPLMYAAERERDSFTVLEVLATAEDQVTKPSAPPTSSTLLLNAALSVFREAFIESESVHEVLTTGPGAVIRHLLQSQLDLQATSNGFTLLLQMASADGDIEFVQLLIHRNVDFKAIAHYYGTALHAASRFGHMSCVKLLLEAGTEIALKAGKFNWTPLRAAVQG
jgi:ankyrin repeat protein